MISLILYIIPIFSLIFFYRSCILSSIGMIFCTKKHNIFFINLIKLFSGHVMLSKIVIFIQLRKFRMSIRITNFAKNKRLDYPYLKWPKKMKLYRSFGGINKTTTNRRREEIYSRNSYRWYDRNVETFGTTLILWWKFVVE